MTLREIRRLVGATHHCAPADDSRYRRYPERETRLRNDRARLLDACMDPAFGWHAVNCLYQKGLRDRIFFGGKLKWVWKAWHMKLGYTSRSLDAVEEAIHIASDRHYPARRYALEGAMVVKGANARKVGELLGLSHKTVECYDTLFFNVMDRSDDLTYISAIIYPRGRIEEMARGFFEHANVGTIVRRIGHGGSDGDLAWAAGLRFSPVDSMAIDVAKEQNERITLAIGAMMVKNFGHYAEPHATIAAARQVIQAGKIGGRDDGTRRGAAAAASEAIMSALEHDRDVLQEAARQKAEAGSCSG